MTPERLRALLEQVKRDDLTVAEASEALSRLPYQDIGVATIDHHRALRQGCPEVVYGEGKTVEQLLGIAQALLDAGENVLVTRLTADKAAPLIDRFEGARYASEARVVAITRTTPAPRGRAHRWPCCVRAAATFPWLRKPSKHCRHWGCPTSGCTTSV